MSTKTDSVSFHRHYKGHGNEQPKRRGGSSGGYRTVAELGHGNEQPKRRGGSSGGYRTVTEPVQKSHGTAERYRCSSSNHRQLTIM